MIKNFIYLDEDKLYSLSSQIFEGMTEYILSENSTQKTKLESQEGPSGSGRILGDILKQSGKTSEKKFLNDYSYTLFETKLLEENLVVILDSSSVISNIQDIIDGKWFIKTKAKATFNDIKSIEETLKNFNEIGKAITHIKNFEVISELKEQIGKKISSTPDRNQKSRLEKQLKNCTNITKSLYENS